MGLVRKPVSFDGQKSFEEGKRCLNAGKLRDAEVAFREAVRYNPHMGRAWFHIALLLESDPTRVREVEEAFQAALRCDPKDPTTWANVGYFYNDHWRVREAAEAYQRAFAFAPADWPLRGEIVRRLSQLKLTALKTVADKSRTWFETSKQHIKDNQLGQAEAALREATRLDPTFAKAWFHLGILLQNDKGRMEEARNAFTAAVQWDPAEPLAWVNLGRALTALGRVQESKDAFERALSLAPPGWGLQAEVRKALSKLDADQVSPGTLPPSDIEPAKIDVPVAREKENQAEIIVPAPRLERFNPPTRGGQKEQGVPALVTVTPSTEKTTAPQVPDIGAPPQESKIAPPVPNIKPLTSKPLTNKPLPPLEVPEPAATIEEPGEKSQILKSTPVEAAPEMGPTNEAVPSYLHEGSPPEVEKTGQPIPPEKPALAQQETKVPDATGKGAGELGPNNASTQPEPDISLPLSVIPLQDDQGASETEEDLFVPKEGAVIPPAETQLATAENNSSKPSPPSVKTPPSKCPFCFEAIRDGKCTFCRAWVCHTCGVVNTPVEWRCKKCNKPQA